MSIVTREEADREVAQAIAKYKVELTRKAVDTSNFEKAVDYIDETWVKGENKDRGKAIVLLGLAISGFNALINEEV